MSTIKDALNRFITGVWFFPYLKQAKETDSPNPIGVTKSGKLVKIRPSAFSSGVQSVTGDGVGGTEENPIINYPNPEDIGAIPNNTADIDATPNTIVKRTSIGAVNTVEPQFPENAVNLAYLNSSMANKVDVAPDMGLSKENFTTEEKSKLAGLEDVHYKGWHPNLLALQTKYPTADEGAHAFVDDASGSVAYIWDVSTNSWVIRAGESTELMPAQAKVLYESNPDTNAFTDVLKAKLEAFTANFTNTLKTAYDGAVTWITANGTNVLNHLSNTNNPHNVTAAQLGIDGLENLGKVWTPDYSNMEMTNRITTHGGTWTIPSGRSGWVKLYTRTYTGGVLDAPVFLINGKVMENIWHEATSGSGTARSGSRSGLFPVKPGDVIQVNGNLERSCYFIPGVWV